MSLTKTTGKTDAKAAIAAAISQINKQYGVGSIQQLGAKPLFCDVIPTGSLSTDIAIGVGGLPKGRIVEIYGPESSGKTTLAISTIAMAQRKGETCAIIDLEHALDPKWVKRNGVNIAELLVSQPGCAEDALAIVESLIDTKAVGVIVVDSVAAMVTKGELEGQMGDVVMGAQARLLSQAMRKLTAKLSTTNTLCIFINQVREKIGGYGNPEVTTGGKALKFFSSVRLEVRKGDIIKAPDGKPLGNKVKVKVVKNKVAPPFKEASFDIMYDEGVSIASNVLELATEAKIIDKKGSWYSYKGVLLGQGEQQAKAHLQVNPDLMQELTDLILTNAAVSKQAPVVVAGEATDDEQDPGLAFTGQVELT